MFILRKSLKLYATLLFEVVGNLEYRCKNINPCKRKNRYAILVFKLNPAFSMQDKLTFLFLICLGKSCPNPNTKVQKIRDVVPDFHELYLILSDNNNFFGRSNGETSA